VQEREYPLIEEASLRYAQETLEEKIEKHESGDFPTRMSRQKIF
jgi:hypothetical protein